MKKIILIILTITSLNVTGQNHLIGIKGGVNWTNINSTNFLSDHGFRTGFSGGLGYEYFFKKYISLGADILYDQRGCTENINLTDENGHPTGDKYAAPYNYDYLSIPIKASFSIGKKVYGFVDLGICPSLLINAKTTSVKYESEGILVEKQTFNDTKFVTKFDLAGLVEIGGGYKFKNRYWLFTAFSFQHSFTTISNSEYYSDSMILHYGMTLSLGLKYALTKK